MSTELQPIPRGEVATQQISPADLMAGGKTAPLSPHPLAARRRVGMEV